MSLKQQNGISLVGVAIFSMAVAAIGMSLLYWERNGHLPFQDVWQRWGKSANVIGNELQKASGVKDLKLPGQESNGVPTPVTVETGVRRCTINGKAVFSDTECTDQNSTTKHLKLNDTQGFVHPKPAESDDQAASGAEQDLRLKMIDKVINKSVR
ncbi:hypothetical protein H8K32_03030 [Undibacterium jejuense]|uniref:DUF4124 domain-containing protein n=1 Tax=Undibacterium jejuense TaxID=1344949 RepID=A0A923HBT6_9BURK|nr:hypothetical protein [Undibacterium jejuense]MBC3861061.1 hypothetical protein [Undibacterium jejuense]